MDISPPKPTLLTPRPQAELKQPDAGKDTAKEFEAVFLTQAVEEMMKTIDLGSFGGGHAEETWRSFLARAFADQIAGQGGTGISQSVESTIAAYRGASKTGTGA